MAEDDNGSDSDAKSRAGEVWSRMDETKVPLVVSQSIDMAMEV